MAYLEISSTEHDIQYVLDVVFCGTNVQVSHLDIAF